MRPALALASTAVVAGAVLAGCGSSGDSPSAATPVSPQLRLAAASETTGKDSARFVLTSDTAVGGRTVSVTADGVSDPTRRLGAVTVHLAGNESQAIQERVVGDALYIAVPGQDGTFYKVSLSDLAGTSLASGADPTAGLQALQAVSSGVTTVGTEQVRGTRTTHYRGAYDAQAALAKVQGAVKQLLASAVQGSDLTSVPFDAWVDDQGRIRRFSEALTITANGQSAKTTSTVEIYDFGTPVDVTAPPASQVKDGTPIVAALKSAGGAPS